VASTVVWSTSMSSPPGHGLAAVVGTSWSALKDFTFDYDRTDIRSSEQNQPSEIAAYARQNPGVRLGIDGATDLLRGTNQYNTGLSQRRVSTVRDALIQAGVSADRIETGPSPPASLNALATRAAASPPPTITMPA
jgi:outer membrane protein OmpA-like peptidoglycan-associated protein